jgi:outer membrane protein assembly factor BamE (lipoprotein component of BamABCDE complex)
MKALKLLLPLVAAVAAFSFAGCATPATRIRQNPEQFATYTPEQQDLIKQGKVAIGFDMDAVRLALGAPDRVRTRETNDGVSQIWSYVTYETTDGLPLYRGWYHRYYMWGDPIYPWYAGYPARREREHFRVIFDRTGRVSTIEQEVG